MSLYSTSTWSYLRNRRWI